MKHHHIIMRISRKYYTDVCASFIIFIDRTTLEFILTDPYEEIEKQIKIILTGILLQ